MSDDVALLLGRAGFGPTATELAAARKAGYPAALSAMLQPPGPDIGATSAPVPDLGPDPYARQPNPTVSQRTSFDATRADQVTQLTRWWLDRMTAADHQAMERLVFFWEGHWATSVTKVKSAQLMLTQHLTMRGASDFSALAHQMIVDPALVYWLDGQLNTRGAANENLAREFFELFTLGIGNYTEQDVKASGRALTGWRIDLAGRRCVFDADVFDGGSKTILGATANFGASSLVDLVLRRPACPQFIASRLWYRYGSSTQPIPARLREAMTAKFPSPTAMLAVLFADDAFRATRATMVKQPIEWIVGAMRQLNIRPADIPAATFTEICDGLAGLGQRPFTPPSVGGWPSGAAWLTSAAAQVRLSLAGKLANLAVDTRLTPQDVAYVLGVDTWTNRTYALLRGERNSRLLMVLGMVSPEYLVT
ncbi:DUF1800 domain-containing protein [Rugosimonospora acidiphila]|uniref:DUF1800 domain-containing protein n=1 Tax=Rugosimonospora acidiphila TaxID=556531 RepID=A0ABP9RSW0_9ACTN